MIYTIDSSDVGLRLDMFVSGKIDRTRSYIKKYIEDGSISVCGATVKAGYKLKKGDKVSINVPEPEKTDILAENIPLDIVYQDEDLLVVNKPQGMTVHPAGKLVSGTLVNALMYHVRDLSGIGGKIRPGIVHRIDKDTSGLLVVAKNDFAHLALQKQIQNKTCYRIYRSVCYGTFKNEEGTVSNYLARGKDRHDKIFVVPKGQGRLAITHYKVLSASHGYSYVEWRLETGRTHQIRVHASSLGHSIVGDKLYGHGAKDTLGQNGQLLHAFELSFIHPRSGERLSFSAPLPDYFLSFLTSKGLS